MNFRVMILSIYKLVCQVVTPSYIEDTCINVFCCITNAHKLSSFSSDTHLLTRTSKRQKSGMVWQNSVPVLGVRLKSCFLTGQGPPTFLALPSSTENLPGIKYL